MFTLSCMSQKSNVLSFTHQTSWYVYKSHSVNHCSCSKLVHLVYKSNTSRSVPLNRKMTVVSIDDLPFRLVVNHQTNFKLRKANGFTPGFFVGLFSSSFQFFVLFVFVLIEFSTALTTILPILFQYCYKYCYSDSRNL